MEYKNFEEWASKWMEDKKEFVKESTYANYSVVMTNHLLPTFGMYKLQEITNNVVQEQVLSWMKTGKINKKGGLSEKTVKDMIVVLKNCLRDWGEYTSQSYDEIHIRYPSMVKPGKNHTFSKDEMKYMLERISAENNYDALGYAISLYTGMRIGEICALQWKDIDLEHKLLYVNKTLQRIYIKDFDGGSTSKVIIASPKSQKSVREIPICSSLFNLLKQLNCDNTENYVLTGTKNFIEPRAYRKHYETFLKRNNIRHINFHGLRHTFATSCIESGADCKVVSELLGHASVNTTLNLYVHPRMEDKRACVELI